MIANPLQSFYLKICYSSYYYLHVSLNLYFIQQHNYFMIIFLYGLFTHNFLIINQLYQDVSFHLLINDFIDFVVLNELEAIVNFPNEMHHFDLHLIVETSFLVENCNYFITISNILKKNHYHHPERLKVQNHCFLERTYSPIQKYSSKNFFVFANFKSCYINQNLHFIPQKHHQTYESLNHFWLFKDTLH